jgi:hypothetical protein
MKWPHISGRENPPRRARWFAPLHVHVFRFAALLVGLLVIGELFFGALLCLDIENANQLKATAPCAGAVVFYIYFILPYLLPVHAALAVFLALAGTAFWAWLDRRGP